MPRMAKIRPEILGALSVEVTAGRIAQTISWWHAIALRDKNLQLGPRKAIRRHEFDR
jgi:hypothetical protein